MNGKPLILTLLLAVVGGAHAQTVDRPPTTPADPVGRAYSPTAGGIAWQRSSDDRAVRGYEISRDGTVLGVRDALSHVARDLQPGRVHRFEIVAIDSAGQRSDRAVALIETPDAPPNRPSGLSANVYSATAAGLLWRRSGAFGERYEVRRDGVVVAASIAATSYIDKTLSGRRPYLFEVIAINRQGRRSSAARLSVRTIDDSSAPPTAGRPSAPSGLRSVVYSATAGAIAWDRPDTNGRRHEISRDGAVVATTNGNTYVDKGLSGGRTYTYAVVAVAADGRRSVATSVTLTTSGGEDAAPDGGEDLPMPTAFRDVEAVADATPYDAIERVDLDALRPGAGEFYRLLSATPGAGTPRFLLSSWYPRADDSENDRQDLLAYDPEAGDLELLATRSALSRPAFSRDLTTVAWSDECAAYVQRLDDGSAPVLVTSRLYENACPRGAMLSDGGEVVVYRGGPDGPLVHDLESGTTTSFEGRYDITLDEADLAGVERVDRGRGRGDGRSLAIADDGNRVFSRTEFLTGRQRQPPTSDIVVGFTVIDTAAGSADLVARHDTELYGCEVNLCGRSEDLAVSGDGRYLFFMRPADDEPLEYDTPARLYRHDIERDETVRVPIDDILSRFSVTTNRDGSRIAYETARGTIVLRLDTGERLLLDRALRGCDAEGCEFDGYRTIKRDSLNFSADGSVLLLEVIFEGATPRNVKEALVLDIDARTVRRLAPGANVDLALPSDDGRTIALGLDDTDQPDARYDDDGDLLVIRR